MPLTDKRLAEIRRQMFYSGALMSHEVITDPLLLALRDLLAEVERFRAREDVVSGILHALAVAMLLPGEPDALFVHVENAGAQGSARFLRDIALDMVTLEG